MTVAKPNLQKHEEAHNRLIASALRTLDAEAGGISALSAALRWWRR
jgi:hypothetical protein